MKCAMSTTSRNVSDKSHLVSTLISRLFHLTFHCDCLPDIRILRTLVTARQKKNHRVAFPAEIQPIAGTEVKPRFGTPSPTGFTSPNWARSKRRICIRTRVYAFWSRKPDSQRLKTDV